MREEVSFTLGMCRDEEAGFSIGMRKQISSLREIHDALVSG